ncbi:nuclear transport factor 2 family protein [Sphingopyxis sp. DBS4]|uniref:nuclear transport factor 2 family protein n=1 Tax=Sphingopyxis sp. DBS4 TaxID=2968500 RepID=UPI00214D043B|nr:nuclear transport factor 2 family protein [Sphingopyxis sp. DBS4]
MTEAEQIAAVAERFFGAVEAGDASTVEACYDPAVVIWHGHTRQAQDRAANVATLTQFIALTRERRYTDRKIHVFDGGFVQQHLLVAIANGGARLELPAALICAVTGNRITRLEEYFDNSAVIEWAKAPDFA